PFRRQHRSHGPLGRFHGTNHGLAPWQVNGTSRTHRGASRPRSGHHDRRRAPVQSLPHQRLAGTGHPVCVSWLGTATPLLPPQLASPPLLNSSITDCTNSFACVSSCVIIRRSMAGTVGFRWLVQYTPC